MIDRAKDVLDKSANLLEEARKALADPNNPDNQQRLAQVLNLYHPLLIITLKPINKEAFTIPPT